ncbi:MAG: S8 family serine peptidase, partial [Pseudomonadota bacterium]|nr:S8 family serine peptidase [Pseudomonadota bacterium]
MPGIRTLLQALACGSAVTLAAGIAAASVSEWTAVRTPPVQIGAQTARLLVGFRLQAPTSHADVTSLALRRKVSLAKSRQITSSTHVLYLQRTLYGADVDSVLEQLRADASVEFAEIDQRRYAQAVPNDPLFIPTAGATGQWYMQTPSSATPTSDAAATDAVSAWTITTGSSGTVIADVDTGVRFDHPDLLRAGFGGRLLPGYDFVGQDYSRTSGAALGTFLAANDGDGWDPDPSDPGDWISSGDLMNAFFPPSECGNPNANNGPSDSSWHGTRVMGLLGALTDNGVGIAGMTWRPYLLPVRALGKCGGYDSDIIAGMQWAAGLTVAGVPDNPYPADIINLSLGGSGACPSSYQTVINTLTNMGVLVVASAGNASGAVTAPGNCSGVLAVAGLRNVGTKVGYSSMGPQVGIAAPAGNCVNSSGACLRSIDTTSNTGLTVPASETYTTQTNVNLGTSFSAPIVAGVIALMRSVNANLTPLQLIARIEASATPFPANTANLPVCPAVEPSTGTNPGACSCVPGQCGAGMVNALHAVQAAQRPIAAVTLPVSTAAGSNATFDASASSASCGRTLSSYAWTASSGITFDTATNAARVTITPGSATDTLTLTVTDSLGATDVAIIQIKPTGASSSAPTSAGTSAGACPSPMTVVPAPPTVATAFAPSSVAPNIASTLTLTFSNANGFALTQSSFTQTLPANLTIATSPAPESTCTGAAGTLTSTSGMVGLVNANIPANGNCSITLSVTSATAGTYTSSIAAGALVTGPAGGNVVAASSNLTVTASSAGGGGGGGDLDWWDMMFVTGVILLGRRQNVPRTPIKVLTLI